jgi:alpha-glucosidase (family GH31 glycosyl hydrolase)
VTQREYEDFELSISFLRASVSPWETLFGIIRIDIMNFSTDIKEKASVESLRLDAIGVESFALQLTRPGGGLWRLQSAVGNGFDDCGAAQILARDLGEKVANDRMAFSVEQQEGGLVVMAGTERLEINLSPFSLNVIRDGELLHITGIQQEGGITVSGSLYEGEALFGGGERFNRAGKRRKKIGIMAVDCWAETEGNSYVPVPFVLSSRSYALFLNRYEYSDLDLGAENKDAWAIIVPNAPLDLYLFIQDNPADILKAYSDLTGYAPMPAPWLFGIQVSRH